MQLRRFLGNFAKTYLAIGALSVSAYAGADDYQNNYNHGYNNNGCHPACAPCAPCCAPTNCCGTPCNPAPNCEWGYNPPAYARCGCEAPCGGFLDSFAFRADFLWWRANEEGLQLGTEESVVSTSTATTPVRTSIVNTTHSKKPNFKYDPGFRIGFANYCSCDCWDFAVNWTHFHTKANVNGASDAATGTVFFSDWERVVGANPTTATGRYTLNLDLVDIEFGRKFYVSNCFILRPEFGLRIARINQSYRVESLSSIEPALDPLVNFTSDVKSRSNFLSVGPRVGVDIELQLGCGMSLFGCAAGSIVFGKFDNHSRENLVDNITETIAEIGDYNYEANSSAHRCSRTITDLAFGIKWDHCYEWCNRSHPVSLAFAWEHHAFYEMNNFNFASNGFSFTNGVGPNGANITKHGNLYTQGLTVSLAFGF